mmetsp:Transcript_28603/g.92081  ORF Transcript_28603/g.92081 Transcript_28603/m.92081 type:complete len:332 (+) Transcript_28603:80-1075(+)
MAPYTRTARRRPAQISTAPLSPGATTLSSAGELVSNYVSARRQRRLTNGDVVLRRSVVVFVVASVVATRARQYSNVYYASFALGFASSASAATCVLPSDNTKVRALLFAVTSKFAVACACSAFFSHRTAVDVREGTCANCAMSAWEVYFWRAHCLISSASAFALVRVARRRPTDILNTLWRVVGVYFILAGVVGLVDHAMSVVTGVHNLSFAANVGGNDDDREATTTAEHSSLKWNLLITTEELAIGLLSSSPRFKVWVWAVAAARANIRVVCGYSYAVVGAADADDQPPGEATVVGGPRAPHSAGEGWKAPCHRRWAVWSASSRSFIDIE